MNICALCWTIDADSTRFFEVSQAFAQAKIPDEIVSALRVGQLTALEKPNSGVCGVVIGDVIRRLVAKTMSQQFMARFKDATKPFQHALLTRAGCEKHCTRGASFDRPQR